MEKVEWRGITNAIDYLYEKDEAGLIMLHEFRDAVEYTPP